MSKNKKSQTKQSYPAIGSYIPEGEGWIANEDEGLLDKPTLLPPVIRRVHDVELMLIPPPSSVQGKITDALMMLSAKASQMAIEKGIDRIDGMRTFMMLAAESSTEVLKLSSKVVMSSVVAWRIAPGAEGSLSIGGNEVKPGISWIDSFESKAARQLIELIGELQLSVQEESLKKSPMSSFGLSVKSENAEDKSSSSSNQSN